MPAGNNTKSKTYLSAYNAESDDNTLKAIREFQGIGRPGDTPKL